MDMQFTNWIAAVVAAAASPNVQQRQSSCRWQLNPLINARPLEIAATRMLPIYSPKYNSSKSSKSWDIIRHLVGGKRGYKIRGCKHFGACEESLWLIYTVRGVCQMSLVLIKWEKGRKRGCSVFRHLSYSSSLSLTKSSLKMTDRMRTSQESLSLSWLLQPGVFIDKGGCSIYLTDRRLAIEM